MVNPKEDLRDWIRPRFDDSAISVPFAASSDLDIANYDVGPAWPSIAIVSADPVTPGGGQTGATGIDGGGGGAIQDTVYLVLVDCWGGPRSADVYADHGSDPVTVANDLATELHASARSIPQNAPSGYEWVFADPPQDANDPEATPTEYRQQVTVRLKTTFRP